MIVVEEIMDWNRFEADSAIPILSDSELENVDDGVDGDGVPSALTPQEIGRLFYGSDWKPIADVVRSEVC